MDIQKMIDDAVEAFRKKLEKEFTELTGTKFERFDKDGELFIADAEQFYVGALIIVGDWEAFRILETPDQKSWIIYTGETFTHKQLAELMRQQDVEPRVLHWGL